MKFGESLIELMYEPWADHYVHYNALKQFVKRISLIESEPDDAANFARRQDSLGDAQEALAIALEQQLAKANAFMQQEVRELEGRLDAVMRKIEEVRALQGFLMAQADASEPSVLHELQTDGMYGPITASAIEHFAACGGDAGLLPSADPASLDMMADVCSALDRVREYGILNYLALLKIVKKHAKWSHSDSLKQRVRNLLPQQYLFNGSGLFELVCKAESVVAGDVVLARARVEEGGAWMESRLVESRMFAMLERAAADVGFPPLPWTVSAKVRPGAGGVPEKTVAEGLLDKARSISEGEGGGSSMPRAGSIGRLEKLDGWRGASEGGKNAAMPLVFRIALTGGPCAGKTSSLTALSDYFTKRGWRVYTSREAASVLLGGGINFEKFGSEQVYETQKAIVKVMTTLEDSYVAICHAGESRDKCLVLCDRGVMDASVYCDKQTWDRILPDVGLDHNSACDARYDAVIHLVTAADGAVQFYTLDSNEEGVRLETPAQAIELDKKTAKAWNSHPTHVTIDNSTDFKGKLTRVISSICNVLGVPAPEGNVKRRKFLVSRANLARAGFEVTTSDCEYTYLISSDNSQHRLRRRTMDGVMLYTHILRSVGTDGKMTDVKRNIDRIQYLQLLAHQDPDRMLIRLIRQSFVYKNRNFQLNTVLGVNPKTKGTTRSPRVSPRPFEGMQLLLVWTDEVGEVELPGDPAIHVDKEVTGMVEYSLFHLSHYSKDASQPQFSTPPLSPQRPLGANRNKS